MSSFPIVADITAPLKDFLADAPAQIKPYLKRGFTALGSLTDKQVTILADLMKESVDQSGEVDIEDLSSKVGIEPEVANVLTTATSLLIALTLSREEEPDAIATELLDSGLANPECREVVTRLLQSLHDDKGSIKHSSELNDLANDILPSFKSFETTLDMRLRFKGSEIDLFVPVIVASLRTDFSRSNSFFQMTKSDVSRLIEQLEKLRNQIEAAERWIQKA
ncbi:hypothetical protein [Terriglobus sp. RCC_193]|uniref:hypothetical protein n=1 Tax=Terriglobus sp. RCC_193 TaxID=3239218 RepID=UPI003525BCC3